MGGIGNCCCNRCVADRIEYYYGDGVTDLSFVMTNVEGVSEGVISNWFGKTAEVCRFTAPLTDCVGSSLRYVDGFWKWLDRQFSFSTSFFSSPQCQSFSGFQRFQTWLTITDLQVRLARATDGTHHISAAAILSHTKAKSVWGTLTTVSRASGLCETSETDSTETTAVPYCRPDTACTTGVAGTCCFSGGWQVGPWGPDWTTPGVYYDSALVFAATVASGWVSHSPTMTATVSDTLYEFRQVPGISEPLECRAPNGVTQTDSGAVSWACGTCNRLSNAYTWPTASSLALTHRLVVEWPE